MPPVLILSTGGTFNKIYDPIRGELVIDPQARALHTIAAKWQADLTISTLIHKDSLQMDDNDRTELIEAVRRASTERIVIVHGTDTMDQSAQALAEAKTGKRIVLTGAMVPFHIDPVEATANLAAAITHAQADSTPGVYLALHGLFGPHGTIVKDRRAGRFVRIAP